MRLFLLVVFLSLGLETFAHNIEGALESNEDPRPKNSGETVLAKLPTWARDDVRKSMGSDSSVSIDSLIQTLKKLPPGADKRDIHTILMQIHVLREEPVTKKRRGLMPRQWDALVEALSIGFPYAKDIVSYLEDDCMHLSQKNWSSIVERLSDSFLLHKRNQNLLPYMGLLKCLATASTTLPQKSFEKLLKIMTESGVGEEVLARFAETMATIAQGSQVADIANAFALAPRPTQDQFAYFFSTRRGEPGVDELLQKHGQKLIGEVREKERSESFYRSRLFFLSEVDPVACEKLLAEEEASLDPVAAKFLRSRFGKPLARPAPLTPAPAASPPRQFWQNYY